MIDTRVYDKNSSPGGKARSHEAGAGTVSRPMTGLNAGSIPAPRVTSVEASGLLDRVHAPIALDTSTMCGVSGYPRPGATGPVFALPGGVVTCPDCKEIIAYAQDQFTPNFRMRQL